MSNIAPGGQGVFHRAVLEVSVPANPVTLNPSISGASQCLRHLKFISCLCCVLSVSSLGQVFSVVSLDVDSSQGIQNPAVHTAVNSYNDSS